MTKPAKTTDIWDAVCETDPNYTKLVDQRGGFTAIDAMYQIQRATKQFGPVGIGWGYDCEYENVIGQNTAMVTCKLTLWHGDRSNCFGPIMAMNPLINFKGNLDDDAAKKAMTDALTKGLSHLGFSADVFMGKFDDNKYVETLREKYKEDQVDPEPEEKAIATHILSVFEERPDHIKMVDGKVIFIHQEGEEGAVDLANLVAWYLPQVKDLKDMLSLCSDNIAVIGELVTANKINAIEQGSCDWASGKIVYHKTQK